MSSPNRSQKNKNRKQSLFHRIKSFVIGSENRISTAIYSLAWNHSPYEWVDCSTVQELVVFRFMRFTYFFSMFQLSDVVIFRRSCRITISQISFKEIGKDTPKIPLKRPRILNWKELVRNHTKKNYFSYEREILMYISIANFQSTFQHHHLKCRKCKECTTPSIPSPRTPTLKSVRWWLKRAVRKNQPELASIL